MIGSPVAHDSFRGAKIFRKGMSSVLAFVLAASMVPRVAWAEAAAGDDAAAAAGKGALSEAPAAPAAPAVPAPSQAPTAEPGKPQVPPPPVAPAASHEAGTGPGDAPAADEGASAPATDAADAGVEDKAAGSSAALPLNAKGNNAIGPVTEQGHLALCRVDIFRSEGGTNVQVNSPTSGHDRVVCEGDKLAARPFTGGSPSGTGGTDVSDDANITYQWMLLDSKDTETGDHLTTDRELTLTSSMVGKYLKVVADGGAGEVKRIIGPVGEIGALRLAGIDIVLPEGKSVILTGDTIGAKAVLSGGIDVSDNPDVAYQWWAQGEGSEGFSPLEGAINKTLNVEEDLAGSDLKVTASVKNYNEVSHIGGPVLSAKSAQAAVAALNDAGYLPKPVYGTDTNMAAMVKAKLAELGFSAAEVRATESGEAQGGAGVALTDDETNGDITYYYEDPETADGPSGSASFRVTFEVMVGETSATWSKFTTIRWDMERVTEKLETVLANDGTFKASDFLMYEGGEADDEANTIDARKDLSLPARYGTWADASWKSSNTAAVTDQGKITRTDADTYAYLTATLTFNLGDSSERAATASKTYKVTVKPASTDPTVEDRVQAALGKIVLKDFATSEPIDEANVTADIQLPTKGSLGIGGFAYKISYAVAEKNDQAIAITGARAKVTRPAPGLPDASDTIVITVTNGGVSLSREFKLTVRALDTTEIDAELAFMEQVKAASFDGLKGENTSADNITGDLSPFMQARSEGSGGIAWAHTAAGVHGLGIVPDDIDPSRPSEQWNLFKSSKPAIIAHETLRFQTQPEYNTEVTIEGCLTSERFGAYYEQHKDDPDINPAVLAKYKVLHRQPVSLTVTVPGTTGLDDPNPPAEFMASVKVIGKEGTAFMPKSEYRAAEGETAWDATVSAFGANGYSFTGAGILSSVTDPSGTKLGDGAHNWVLFINGIYSDLYAFNYGLKANDEVVWVYTETGQASLPKPGIELNPDAEHPDLGTDWGGFANGGSGSVVEGISTATEPTEDAWTLSFLENGNLPRAMSDPLMVGGKLYFVTAYQFFDDSWNSVTTSYLWVINPATGRVEQKKELAAFADSTCRPVYAEGIIVVPLTEGYLQALSASTLETLWVAEGVPGYAQSLSTLTVFDGYVYVSTVDRMGTADDKEQIAKEGSIRRFNLFTGALAGQVKDTTTGYYWAGGAMVGGFFVVPDDSGHVSAYTPDLKTKVGESLKVTDARLRSTLMVSGSHIYAASYDGAFHEIAIDSEGRLERGREVSFADRSTSTPTISGGYAYVGGGLTNYKGVLAVIDLTSMRVVHSITQAGGEPVLSEVKSAPLVSVQGLDTYVYFTCNGAYNAEGGPWGDYVTGGGVWIYRLGDSEASLLYDPPNELRGFSMASVIVGPDGTLYYTNDSGHMFALKAKLEAVGPGGDEGKPDPDESKPGPDEGGDSKPGPDEGKPSPDEGTPGLDGGKESDKAPAGKPSSVASGRTPVAKDSVKPTRDGAKATGSGEQKESKSDDAPEGIKDERAAKTDAPAPVSGQSGGAPEAKAEGARAVNPWAVGGIALGAVGLGCVGAYVFGLRRRIGA